MASAQGSGAGSSPNKWSGSSDTDGLNGTQSNTNYTPSSARNKLAHEADPMCVALYDSRHESYEMRASVGAAGDEPAAMLPNGVDPSANIVFHRPPRPLESIRGLDLQETRDLQMRFMADVIAVIGTENFGQDPFFGDILTPLLYCGGVKKTVFQDRPGMHGTSFVNRFGVVRIYHSEDTDEAFLSFNDLRECGAAKAALAHCAGAIADTSDLDFRLVPNPTLGCIGPQQFKKATGLEPYPKSLASNTAFVGMILIQVIPAHMNPYERRISSKATPQNLLNVVMLRLQKQFGERIQYVKALGYVNPLLDQGLPTVTFVVEFYDNEFADRYAELDGPVELNPNEPYHTWAMPFRAEVLHSQVDYSRVDAGMRQMVQQFRARRIYAEALGHTHHGFHGAHGAHGNAHHGFHGARGYNGMHNNNIMLRNIPNRMTHADLKTLVDSVAWGHYDFLYLRIDFANNCNVGYAFINFITAGAVHEFVSQVRGRKWLHSDKYADCSYATIQGRETLIEKFRNSSVMNERLSARPRLYWPFTAPDQSLVGTEEPFPEPNNYVKLSRSVDNARAIGLYNPVRGAGSFDRRRRGQYDRGTSYSAMEQLQVDNGHWHNAAAQGQPYPSQPFSPAYF